MRELVALCWEALRTRDFAPHGQDIWGGWIFSATEQQLKQCAADLEIPGYHKGPKAIETRHAGRKFRSRLEARWSVYWTAQGVEYEYEKEGFVLASGPYLPDFWLPQVRMWAEVKPGAFGPLELTKCRELADATDCPCLLLEGPPALRPYRAAQRFEIDEMDLVPYVLTNRLLESGQFHRYEVPADMAYHWPDVKRAVDAATSARFEFGEAA